MKQAVIIYDGNCGLCSRSIQFILRNDPSAVFSFASAQSKCGLALQAEYAIDSIAENTMVLIDSGVAFTKSTAVLKIAIQLEPVWCKFAYFGLIIPRFLRDPVYTIIARNRQKFFNAEVSCLMPTPEQQKRFLD
ncbi:MAG: DCC1-like thiol-disulfide oxidoreductase family protein [Lentisphaeria bacterium]|nr:DCC1-like thiol-disulfide oxidoreductase family protein [Lentisphaeria bacterium]